MSALARWYKFRGLEVSGYDRTPSDLTAALEAEGISVHYTDQPERIPADKALKKSKSICRLYRKLYKVCFLIMSGLT